MPGIGSSSVEDPHTTPGNPFDPQVEHLACVLHSQGVPLNITRIVKGELAIELVYLVGEAHKSGSPNRRSLVLASLLVDHQLLQAGLE